MHQTANVNDDFVNKVQASVPEIHFFIVSKKIRKFEVIWKLHYYNIINIYI